MDFYSLTGIVCVIVALVLFAIIWTRRDGVTLAPSAEVAMLINGLIRPLLYLTRRAEASRFSPSHDSFTQFYQSLHF